MTMKTGLVERFEILLHQWAGQWFPGSRRGELVRALQRSCERAGFGAEVERFLAVLEGQPDEALRDLVIQEILVGETYFFRDSALWESLEQEILPDLLERRASGRNLRIWSSGCSTGEEPYSLAMMLRALLPRFEDWTLHLLATDLSETSLERARMAVYGRRALRELDARRWGTWFEASHGTVRLHESIRQMVHFRRHNLSAEDFPDPLTNRMDLILCRNVLIYLDRGLVDRVIQRFADCLRSSGWLILAPTELPLEPPPGLRLVRLRSGTVVLQRVAAAAQHAPAPTAPRSSRPAAQVLLPLPPPVPAAAAPPPAPPPLPPPPPPPPPDAGDLLAEARSAADRGNLAVALARATACVEAAPVSPAGWLVLALIQEEMDLLGDSLDSLRRALYLDSSLALGHLQLARVQSRRGDEGFLRSLANFRKLTEGAAPASPLPEGAGLTVGEARHLADLLERSQAGAGVEP